MKNKKVFLTITIILLIILLCLFLFNKKDNSKENITSNNNSNDTSNIENNSNIDSNILPINSNSNSNVNSNIVSNSTKASNSNSNKPSNNNSNSNKSNSNSNKSSNSNKTSNNNSNINSNLNSNNNEPEYTCPNGFTLNGTKCTITIDAHYDCPKGSHSSSDGNISGCIIFSEAVETPTGDCPVDQIMITQISLGGPNKYMCYPLHNKVLTCYEGYTLVNNNKCTATIDATKK